MAKPHLLPPLGPAGGLAFYFLEKTVWLKACCLPANFATSIPILTLLREKGASVFYSKLCHNGYCPGYSLWGSGPASGWGALWVPTPYMLQHSTQHVAKMVLIITSAEKRRPPSGLSQMDLHTYQFLWVLQAQGSYMNYHLIQSANEKHGCITGSLWQHRRAAPSWFVLVLAVK